MTDAISQIHASIEEWTLRGSSHPANIERLKGIYTVKPKGIIVVGSLVQVANDRTKRETLELCRKSIHGVDIITFDELFERAWFIVGAPNITFTRARERPMGFSIRDFYSE